MFLRDSKGWRGEQADEAEQAVQEEVPPFPADSPTIPPGPPHVVFEEEAPRKVYVKTDVLKQIVYTLGCPGFRASDHCRKRAVDTMKETIVGRERLSATRKRGFEFLARAVQRSDPSSSDCPRMGDSAIISSLLVAIQVDSP